VNRFLTPEAKGFDRTFCIYACIGLRQAEIARLYRFFYKKGVS
jgi:hypothetical protein